MMLCSLIFSAFQPQSLSVAQANVPTTVTIPGTLQSELGCAGDWMPDCEATFLQYDAEDDVWQGTFLVQPNNDQDKKGPRYKAALNKGWTENYGANAASGGADIALVVSEPTEVKFYYDHKTHWVTDNFNSVIAVAVGDFQSEMGCANDNEPGCLRSWLQDPQGSGIYSLITSQIPAGDYSFRVALDESDAEIIGADGVMDGEPVQFTVANDGDEIYLAYEPATNAVTVSTEGAPKGSLNKAMAYWVSRDTILWRGTGSPKYTYQLHYAPQGGLQITAAGIEGGTAVPLTFDVKGAGEQVYAKFPHLKGLSALKLSEADLENVPEMLRGQVGIAVFDDKQNLVDVTALQIPGVLDDLYPYSGELGVTFTDGTPTLRLWAPTAVSVGLQIFPDSTSAASEQASLTFDPSTGVWSITGKADWKNKYYLYEVEVYVPSTGKVEKNLVTDPYSISLSMNSLRSQMVDLKDADLQPQDWLTLDKPALQAFEDSVIYELHVRDFSVNDMSVPQDLRGTFMAFTIEDSNGMQHLKKLAEAGLTHVHLLPVFDIASINEDKSTWVTADAETLAGFPPNSDQQQIALAPYKDQDAFNWGYDPLHYTSPEGSYATDPDGSVRVIEFRQMVQALNQAGLRVVMDVVYNHTNASGQNAKSVLDKVVPGYYHRLNGEGAVETSTCCQNTATEHAMMEKLMIDSLVTWAKDYKVDGFRFDLMGHHMVANMEHVRQALDALTLEKDGVDGSKILIYGEGWDFGEVAGNARGKNATQLNLDGTGIGSFNDRLRDGARGGGPFNPVQEQGFLTGLYDAPNGSSQGTPEQQLSRLMAYEDWIRVSMAGNLTKLRIETITGKKLSGQLIDYNGNPAGYAVDPQENIVYIAAHDNETLFDAIQYKAPAEATIQDRVRMNNLGISLVLLSQGIPFFHAGDELLRSKSLDGNSYNSGDWFNRLDFTYQTNNWGVGLPNFRQDSWPLMAELLGNPDLQVSAADIEFSLAHFLEMLQIRKSSPLFRLQTAEDILQRLSFLNTGPEQTPGLIIMVLDDSVDVDLDPQVHKIVVALNATQDLVQFTDASLQGLDLKLHPIQQNSVDAVVKQSSYDSANGSLSIPGRTAAIFIVEQEFVPEAAATEAPAPIPEATEEIQAPAEQEETAITEEPPVEPEAEQSKLPLVIGASLAILLVSGLFFTLRLRKKNPPTQNP
jgi:pullulanase-type alpha-1,6-glucosidase